MIIYKVIFMKTLLLFIFTITIVHINLDAQIITTFAGHGPSGLGDGGPATLARFNNPSGVAIDASNNVYIADLDNDRIRKVNSSGVISTIAGNGTEGYGGDGGP